MNKRDWMEKGSKRLWRVLAAAFLFLIVIVNIPPIVSEPAAQTGANFTRGTQQANLYGTHEIVLQGDGSYATGNPFDVRASVSFRSSSGTETVEAFYDGNNIWRARTYVDETGNWQWSSSSSENSLNSRSGSFSATASNLKGMLGRHSTSPKQWMTDNGQTFINVADTAYFFFTRSESDWQQYIREDINHGITMIRADVLGGALSWDMFWSNSARDQFHLSNFQNMDVRLQWLLNNYPDLQVQVKLLPGPNSYGADESVWQTLSSSVRSNLLRYMVSRWTAYPNVIFEVAGDTRCTSSYPNTRAMAREVGNYFQNNDPWNNLMSFGPTRDMVFCFSNESWASYIAIETSYDIAADEADRYSSTPKHLYCEEDYYETYYPPSYPAYFYRRLMWSYLLSGGSATYGGDWDTLTPYSQTGLSGMNSLSYIVRYFRNRNIDLAFFSFNDSIAQEVGAEGANARAQVANRGTDEYLIYLPNANSNSNSSANVNGSRTPVARVNLTDAGKNYNAEWYRVRDGTARSGTSTVSGGGWREITSPWQGEDTVLRLLFTDAAVATATPPLLTPPTAPPTTPAPIGAAGQTECEEMGGECVQFRYGHCPDGYNLEPRGDWGDYGCPNTLFNRRRCCIPLASGCHPWSPFRGCQEGFERCPYPVGTICYAENSQEAFNTCCTPPDHPVSNPQYYCDPNDPTSGIETAIGCIPYMNMNSFSAFMLVWFIGLGGGIAFLMMLFGGFLLITSAGNPERVRAGRTILVSALSGLLFIVFSVFLLRTIGVDILNIPDF